MSKVIHKAYSWGEFVAAAKLGFGPGWNRRNASSITGSYGFCGTHTYGDSLALLESGWKECADKIERDLSAILPSETAPCFTLDVAGAYPLAPLAAAGDPACMLTRGETVGHRKTLTLVCSFSYHRGVPVECAYNHGLATCAIIDALEASGVRVELIADRRAIGAGFDFGMAVTVKELHAQLDLYRVAYAFCHASMLRRTGFRIEEQHLPPDWGNHGYGTPTASNPANYPPGAIFIPGACTFDSDLDNARKRIETALEQQRDAQDKAA